MSQAHRSQGWGGARSPKAGAVPVTSRGVGGAKPFDVRAVVDGAPCMGRWQFCSTQNVHYFVHADGEWVTPSRLCTRPRAPSNSSRTPVSSDDDQGGTGDDEEEDEDFEVEDGAEYLGPHRAYNFYFYSSPGGDSETVVCVQRPILTDLLIDWTDVMVLNGVMHTGCMTGTAGTPDTDTDDFRFEHNDGEVTMAYPAAPAAPDGDEQ